MDGNNHHGYLQEEVSYDDLMNNAGWPGPGDQFTYPPQQQQHQSVQDGGYPQYQSAQPSFDQYNLSNQSANTYAPSFSNSPYAAQYQHARPSDVFGPSSYNVDPSLQPYPGPESPFSFNPQEDANTISPHSLQYSTPSNQPASRGASNAMFQRPVANYNQRPQEQSQLYNYYNGSILNTGNSLQYPALPAAPTEQESNQNIKTNSRNFDIIIPNTAHPPPTQPNPVQNSLRVTHPELINGNNNSTRPKFEYAPFLAWNDTPLQVTPGLKS
jgi:hypothetical protein